MFSLLFLLIVATLSKRVASCTDFDPKCALVQEIRNSAQVTILLDICIQSFPKKDLQCFRFHFPVFRLPAKIGERNM